MLIEANSIYFTKK